MKTFKKIAIALLAGAIAIAIASSSASAHTSGTSTPVTAVSTDTSTTVGVVVANDSEEIFAAYATADIESGNTVRVFCIQFGSILPEELGVNFSASARDSLRNGSQEGISSAAWLVSHLTYDASGTPTGASIGTPISADQLPAGAPSEVLVQAEAGATQMALWSLVNGADLSQFVGHTGQPLIDRANEIVALSVGQEAPEAPHAFDLHISAVETGVGTHFLLIDAAGDISEGQSKQIAGAVITVSVPESSGIDLDSFVEGNQSTVTLVTDSSGQAFTTSFVTPEAGVTATATVNFILPAGTILTPTDELFQQVITADNALVTRSAATEITAVVGEVQTDDALPVELPHTGGNVTVLVLLIGSLAGAAGVLTIGRAKA